MKCATAWLTCVVMMLILPSGVLWAAQAQSDQQIEKTVEMLQTGKGSESASESGSDKTQADKSDAVNTQADKAKPDKTKAEEPADKQGDKGAEKKADKPAGANTQPPADKPADKPTDSKPAAEGEAKKPAAPSTHTIKRGLLRIEVSLDGVFEAQRMSEIVLRPQEWSGFTVLSAVEHGASVRQGDLLVAFETEKIDRAIADLRAEQQLTDLTLRQTERTVAALERLTPLDLAAAQRADRIAREDYKEYLEVGRPLALRTLEFNLKTAKETLEYQEEELRQLEKMYKADDITEETEEIVLRRARNAVERARFLYERAQILHQQSLKYELPRADERVKESVERAAIQWERDRILLPLALEKQKLELEKLRVQRARQEDRLRKLMADRELMTLRAPHDGVVYYGKCTRGKWGSTTTADELPRGATVAANTVFMTVVQAKPLGVRATLPEKELHQVVAGTKGTVRPTGFPEARLTGIVQRVSQAPLPSGGFDLRMTVANSPQAAQVMPGMNCNIKLVVYEKPDALLVPVGAVHTTDAEPPQHYVQVVAKDGQSRKQQVEIGKRSDKMVEILKGLAEGDVVLAEYPADAK